MSEATHTTPNDCGCDDDPIEGLRRLFVDEFQSPALAAGRAPATRPVFLRLHGVAHGDLAVRDDLPPALAVGIFAPGKRYDAWIRFSSDLQPGVPDAGGTVGIGIKLFGVPGPKLLSPDTDAGTHDLILQNHPVFFVDDAATMCAFTCASLHGRSDAWLADHPRTKEILDAMRKDVPSVLSTPYWSVLPYRFGPTEYVKYLLRPDAETGGDFDRDDPSYLRADLHRRLAARDASFGLFVQRRVGDMPLDQATVPWDESVSAPERVATLRLPRQDVEARGQRAYGEALAFNPWHAIEDHRPAGSLSDARRVVYRASADNRRDVNGQPRGEPTAPRPSSWRGGPYPAAVDRVVVRAAIHPAIGIARVGGAEGHFLAPEVVPSAPAEPGSRRDDTGALLRQAVRFRIYGYNAAGDAVAELTSDVAEIAWTVHIANRKAAWYQWQLALDIPDAKDVAVPLRNPKVTGADRAALEIDPGPASVSGNDATPRPLRGAFQGTAVELGAIHTDGDGRLVFVGGRGVSRSPTGTPIYDTNDPNAFINANGWYDDTSDGPVHATVSIDGRSVPVDGAWVVTAPPDYAPSILGVRTLYDLLVDRFVDGGWLPKPAAVSFQRDVLPILSRLAGLGWVNRGFETAFGRGGPYPFDDPRFLARLGGPDSARGGDRDAELRRQIFNSFRLAEPTDANQLPWPWIYGDAMEVPAGTDPRQNASVTALQHEVLARWASGDFARDYDPDATAPATLDALPLAQRPAMLDRAALDHALADAFHPGCELTWPMRHLSMYRAAFRIREHPSGVVPPSYGPTLTQTDVLAPNGPLGAQGPGDLTRWMGLPWQADTAFCRSHYDETYDPYVPTFWPARVPNQVLTVAQYETLMDAQRPEEERREAFADRASWTAPLRGSVADQMVQMVDGFDGMGLLERREGPTDLPEIPSWLLVAASGPAAPAAPTPDATLEAVTKAAPGPAGPRHDWPKHVRKPKR